MTRCVANRVSSAPSLVSHPPPLRVLSLLLLLLLLASSTPTRVRACSTFLVGKDASSDGSLYVTHSDDGEGNPDVRLAFIPAATHAPGSERAIWPDLEDNPRYVGDARGETYRARSERERDEKTTRPVGFIPQVARTYAYTEGNYGIMNEKQLSIGESTCSGVFTAKGAHDGGDALFCVNELSRIAMERCVTARCAVALMGDLAERHGFYGASGGVEGGSETLLVADTTEGWVMHFVPYPANNSAVWAARRVPDDEVTVVMNMFTIREVDGGDPDNFMHSANMLPVAIEHRLWNPIGSDGHFDFTKAFSDGEYAHKYYSGRRVWGAFRLINPSLKLSPEYGDLRLDAPYPFSVKPARPVAARDLFAWHRDWYQGTPFDVTRAGDVAGGPWSTPDRYGGGDAEASLPGAVERTIALYRTTYTHVLQTRAWLPDRVGGVTWFGPHAAHGTCFVPVFAGCEAAPSALNVGNASTIDRGSAWWAHRFAHNLAQLKFKHAIEDVRAAQEKWESAGFALVDELSAGSGGAAGGDGETSTTYASPAALTAASEAHAAAVARAWWRLGDDLMVRYADGFVSPSMDDESGAGDALPGTAVGYPAWWLNASGWKDGPPPPPPPRKVPNGGGGEAAGVTRGRVEGRWNVDRRRRGGRRVVRA